MRDITEKERSNRAVDDSPALMIERASCIKVGSHPSLLPLFVQAQALTLERNPRKDNSKRVSLFISTLPALGTHSH